MGRRYLFCSVCEAEYSADGGDYFMAPADHLFKCCEENMWLVEKRGRFTGDGILAQTVTVAMLRQRRVKI